VNSKFSIIDHDDYYIISYYKIMLKTVVRLNIFVETVIFIGIL